MTDLKRKLWFVKFSNACHQNFSSLRFFDNMELWKVCLPPQNCVKVKSIVIMFPLKRSSKVNIFQQHPLPPS